MSSSRVVVFTPEDDAHLPYLTKHLTSEPIVLNVGRAGEGVTYEFDGRKPWPTVRFVGRTLDLRPGAVSGVWCRTMNYAQLAPTMSFRPDMKEYIEGGLGRLAESLSAFFRPDVVWAPGTREAVNRAVLKPHQLVQASLCGFRVPETIFTSDSAEAQRFIRKHGTCIVKPLAPFPPKGMNQYTKLMKDGEVTFQGLGLTPQIFQELIEPAFELRVYVIRDQVFASIVRDKAADDARALGIRDFRRSFDNGTFEATPFTLPASVAQSCVQLLHRLNLTVGAIDIIVDRKGRYYFLEINPNGQWAFVAPETVAEIGKTLAQLLETGVC